MTDRPILRTDRTVVRLLTPEYAERTRSYYDDSRAHLQPWEPGRDETFYTTPYWVDQAAKAVQDFEDDRAVRLIALDPQEGEVLAYCSFSNIVRGPFHGCYLGYSIARAHEGTGLMFEIASRAITYMFEEKNLHRIMANHLPDNRRCEKLLARLGFTREGLARSYLHINGQWRDHVLNALVNPDWIEPKVDDIQRDSSYTADSA